MFFPVTLSGLGLVGSVFSLLCEHYKIKSLVLESNLIFQDNLELDDRSIALAPFSRSIFEFLGLWSQIEPFCEPILKIKIFEEGHGYSINYNSKDFHNEALGYIIWHKELQKILKNALKKAKFLYFCEKSKIQTWTPSVHYVDLNLQNGENFQTSLLVGCEGRHSATRDQSRIITQIRDYPETASVFHINHQEPHQGTAWEIFQKEGLLALLPLPPSHENGYQSGVVYTKKTRWEDYSDQEIETEIFEIFPFYGTVQIATPRWTFPLKMLKTDRLIDDRFVIIGDAAHVLHPVAGQGANLGWRDAFYLAKTLSKYHQLGLDLGSPFALQEYEKERKLDHKKFFTSTHYLRRLFEFKHLGFLREFGGGLINRSSLIKKFLIKQASGF